MILANDLQSDVAIYGDVGVEDLPKKVYLESPEQFRCNEQPEIPLYECTWKSKEDGLIVIRQNWLPGWYAMLDGKKHRVASVNDYMIGLFAPRGEHKVVLRYRALGSVWGWGLCLLGIGLLGIIINARLRGDD